jgi:hypothetical protein
MNRDVNQISKTNHFEGKLLFRGHQPFHQRKSIRALKRTHISIKKALPPKNLVRRANTSLVIALLRNWVKFYFRISQHIEKIRKKLDNC